MVAAGVLLSAATASAHAEFLDSEPKGGAKLDQAPTRVVIDFSEPPVSAREVVVQDGCRNDVVASAEVEDKQAVAELADGEPGRWRVIYRVVSAVDGHPTDGGFSFRVVDSPDCSATDATPPPREERDGGGGSTIIIGIGAATVLLVGAALVLRRQS